MDIYDNSKREKNINIDSECRDLWSKIIKLNLTSIILELQKRKLKTDGKLSDLRSRLLRYFKGDYLESDFDKITLPENTINNINMSDRIPFCKPNKFSGAIHENVNSFLNKYNKASTINGWSDEQKVSFLTIYLQDTASTFLENFEQLNTKATWKQIEDAFRLEFEPTSQTHMLRTMLEKRQQLSDESIASYINDAENLCKRIDSNMSQSELVHIIMKGLKPEIARYVGILDNNNLQDLKKNIRKYESVEFMLNGKTTHSPDEIRNQITKEHINIIDENKTQKQIEQLSSQISNIESILKNLNTNRNNQNNWSKNPNNQNPQYNNYNRQPFINYNNNFKNLKDNSNLNNSKGNNRNNFNRSNNYIQNSNNNYSNKYNNSSNYQRQNRNFTNKTNPKTENQNFANKCEHCHKNNHTSTQCKWKLICDLCNKRYHTSDTCYLANKYTNQKNM
jgi:hypothetical protein